MQLEKQGFHRTAKQVLSKIKQLKKQYKESVDKLHKSGVGLDSNEEESEIYVGFKWFFDLHAVMKRRALVNPPALLESASAQQATSQQTSSELDKVRASLPMPQLTVHDADEAAASSLLHVQLPVASDSALQQQPESCVEALSTTTAATSSTTTILSTGSGSKTRVAKNSKRKLTKLERAEKKIDNMLEELIKANR